MDWSGPLFSEMVMLDVFSSNIQRCPKNFIIQQLTIYHAEKHKCMIGEFQVMKNNSCRDISNVPASYEKSINTCFLRTGPKSYELYIFGKSFDNQMTVFLCYLEACSAAIYTCHFDL